MDQYLSQLETFANENLMPYAWNIIAALVIFIVGKWIVGKIAGWLGRVMDKKLDTEVAKFLSNIIHVLLFVFVIIASLDQLGVETTSLVAKSFHKTTAA